MCMISTFTIDYCKLLKQIRERCALFAVPPEKNKLLLFIIEGRHGWT